MDNQIKLRGLRIELGEIEEVINSYEGIITSITVPVDNKYLCCYFIADREISPEELSDYAAESLAHYMVPEVFIQLEKMPITQNGKIDKKALPKPIAQPKNLKEPETVMQKKIFQIVAKVVENDFFGIDTSFYKELPSSKDMMEVCKEIFPVFSNIDRCSEQTSLFKLKGAHKLSLQFLKLLICGLDHLRYKGFIVRLLYHFTSVIQIHPCEQIGMCTYCTGNGI